MAGVAYRASRTGSPGSTDVPEAAPSSVPSGLESDRVEADVEGGRTP